MPRNRPTAPTAIGLRSRMPATSRSGPTSRRPGIGTRSASATVVVTAAVSAEQQAEVEQRGDAPAAGSRSRARARRARPGCGSGGSERARRGGHRARRRRSRPHCAERGAGRQVYRCQPAGRADQRAEAPSPRTSATATMAAVSTRRMRGPRLDRHEAGRPRGRASRRGEARPPGRRAARSRRRIAGSSARSGPAALRSGYSTSRRAGRSGAASAAASAAGAVDDRNVRPPALPGRLARDLLPARAPPRLGTRDGARRR